MSKNTNLHEAKKKANDEWYTPKTAIEAEIKYYWRMYYQDVINWVHKLFPKYRQRKTIITNQEWGLLYNKYHSNTYNPNEFEQTIECLMKDEDVQNKRGVIPYLFDGAEKHLNLRAFSESQKLAAYESQNGVCPICGEHFEYEQMQGDHIVPWSSGGKTVQENCQMLCKKCNNEKSNH